MSGTFDHAPAPVLIDGLTAVAADVTLVEARLVFDVATATATADATMHFTLGPTSGHAVFDLRQQVDAAWLDGAPLAVSEIAHHNLGGGAGADVRILGSSLAAGTSHTLRLTYPLNTPDAGGAVPITFAGDRLGFDFWFTDLTPGRYLEMWLPAPLLWDRFALQLDIEVVGTSRPHVPITNGTLTTLAGNHWLIEGPAWWNASCPMLVIAAADEVSSTTTSVTPPGEPTINAEIWRGPGVVTSLTSLRAQVTTHLTDFAADVGAYCHGNRFVAYVWNNPSRAMEYAGGTTTTVGALGHETYHSWFARGVLPATADDGWFDEAITSWATGGEPSSPLDLSRPPTTLCARNAWVRRTPNASYAMGRDVVGGLAAEVGVPTLKAALAAIYAAHAQDQLSTVMLEEELIVRTGSLRVADWFGRYVYGLSDAGGADLWLRDAPGDPGEDAFTGSRFWDSPDLWVRNANDGGTTHQAPEFGQDNWLYARVRNRGTATARHWVVTFRPALFAGTEFVFPADWLPPVAAAVGFELPPGDSTVVSARWPRQLIPAAGTHQCLLAAVSTSTDAPLNGRSVWADNNLAQKNLTIVDLAPNDIYALPFRVGNLRHSKGQEGHLELVRPARFPRSAVEIVGADATFVQRLRNTRVFASAAPTLRPGSILFTTPTRLQTDGAIVEVATGSMLRWEQEPISPWTRGRLAGRTEISSRQVAGFAGGVGFASGAVARLPLELRARESASLSLRIAVPPQARPGEVLLYDILQRDESDTVSGGISLQVNVR